MEIIDIPQLSDEWFQEVLGSIGGSSIQAVCAKGKGKTRKDLLYRKAGEILSNQPYHGYYNEHMQRGNDTEEEARTAYSFFMNTDVKQVGLIRESKYKHVSPDGLVEYDGSIEIKCVIPSVHIETIDNDRVPANYRKQTQWLLHIGQLKWCDFISYCPQIKDKPLHAIRVGRNEELIEEMDKESDKFITEMLELVERIKNN